MDSDLSYDLLPNHRQPNQAAYVTFGLLCAIAIGVAIIAIVAIAVLSLSVLTYLEVHSNNNNNSSSDIGDLNVLCSLVCQKSCIGRDASSCYDPCYTSCSNPSRSRANESSVLGGYIRRDAIHHVGVTVANLTRSVDFYTNVLGGSLVPHAGGDGWNGDDVFQLLFQENLLQGKNKTLEQLQIANISTSGPATLAARYVSFGATIVELLDYRARNTTPPNETVLPYHYENTSPSIVPAMHICFYLHDDVDMDRFILTLEEESQKRGYDKVKCNRIVPVANESQRVSVGKELKYNSYFVKDGPFMGWRLDYCKGPDGEQFEIAQALGTAKKLFQEGAAAYLSSK